MVVMESKDKRSVDQNAALHAALTDIAQQVQHYGQKYPAGVWKRLCTAAWLRENGECPLLIPSLDGMGIDMIFERTSKMSKAQMSSLIDWIHCFGAEHDVKFRTNREE